MFRCPGTKTFVHIYVGLWMMSIQWGVFQLDVELHLLVEELISSVSAEAYEKLYLVLSDFLPLLLSFGEKSGLSGTSTLSDTYCRNIEFSDTLSSVNVCGKFAMCCIYMIL